MKKKIGRNDPCPCGSGKKFKKCCERKMIGGRFTAQKIDSKSVASRITTASPLTSVFKKKVSIVQSGEESKETKEIKPSEEDNPPEDKPSKE